MCILQMHVQCTHRFIEILPEEKERAELIVENVVSHGLLDIFDRVAVDEVAIHCSSNARAGQPYCSIQIYADCLCEFFPLRPHEEEDMKQSVIAIVSPRLKELFGSVEIDNITFSPSPWDFEHDPVLSQSA